MSRKDPNCPKTWGRGFYEDNLDLKTGVVRTALYFKHKYGSSLVSETGSSSNRCVEENAYEVLNMVKE
jgi:hypothetical protein